MIKVPDRIYIEKGDRETKYKKLLELPCFSNMENKDIFLYAMSIGFSLGVREKIKSREGFFLANLLEEDHYSTTILYSVALFETNNDEILADIKEVFNIAEEYANSGVSFLIAKFEQIQFGSYLKHLEKEVFTEFEKFKEIIPET